MIKKINIFLILLLLFISISAVSAVDDGNITELCSNEAVDAIGVSTNENIGYSLDDVVSVDDSSSEISAKSYTINNDNYYEYFDYSSGKLVSSQINDGDTIVLDGNFSDKSFVFDKKVNIVGTSTNYMKNSIITLSSNASGSSITNLKIVNTKDETYGIFLNSANNCSITLCSINNTGRSSYCICLANGANYNNVTDNKLKAYGITYGHGSFTRSTPPLILSGSHHNYVANNHVEADDANGIYLSSYSGGPLKGGDSNYNLIFNNTVHYNVLPTSWAYGIQVMGSNNIIDKNTVIGGYRGVSTSGFGNTIKNNYIINLTGADYNNPSVESGGEYAIVASYNSIVMNNTVIGAKVISTGAGITAIDNSVVENNWVNVTEKGRGIVGGGSNVIIRNNVIFTQSGSGVYQKDEGSGLLVDGNNITSVSGVGILIEKLSSKRMPKNVTVINNIISTNNKFAIDAAGVQANTSNIDLKSNIVGDGLINSPSGVINTSKPTYTYKGTVHTITPENIRMYINDNGGLTSEINDDDILKFEGTFSNEVIYITKPVKITGKSPTFYNSTFKVTCGNVLIENLTIINKNAERVNAWGIFVNQAPGVRIQNNKISVTDPKASYAIYVLQSTDIEVFNNELFSEGDYLTFTLLVYACEDCNFTNNTIRTVGTGQSYQFSPEKCIDGNELVINGRSYCLDGNELVIDGTSYRLNGTELIIDGQSYCLDGNELVIDGKSYCIDGNEFSINGISYCIDGNEFVIDGTRYCIDGNEVTIDGKSYCLDGNEVTIDGKSYCLDGNELVIDGRSYCLDGNEITIDGKSYCLDGNELVIDGKSYCIDGGELVIDGKSYCVDGNEYCMDGAHVVSEIYQTYGILLLYSSNNVVSGNDVNVTSKLTQQQATMGNKSSQNSLVGIDLYFNCHNNIISNNNVFIKSMDNYIYGMGVLGYYTGHNAPEGQGATNNKFLGNEITIDGIYCVEGIIIGDESEDTLIENNVINLKSDACAYGIYFEMSQKSIVKNNNLTSDSQAIYGIEGYASNDNIVLGNIVNADGKKVYGVLFLNGNNNNISNNKINANGNDENLTVRILDSIGTGNAGIYLMANSTNNYIVNNEVNSSKGFAVSLDDEAINNVIADNLLDCEKGIGNKAVNNSRGNNISYNYKYVATAEYSKTTYPCVSTGEVILKFDENLTGAIVKFYDSYGSEFAQSTVVNDVAVAIYKFGACLPAHYLFTAKLFKEDYKVSTFDLEIRIVRSNLNVSVPSVIIPQGSTGNIVATVLYESGNPVSGTFVKFYRLNSAGKETYIGSAQSNEEGIATLRYAVPLTLTPGDHELIVKVDEFVYYNAASIFSTLSVPQTSLGTVIVMESTFSRYSTDYYGDERGAYFYGTLYDVLGNPLSGKTVQIAINGVFYEVTTDNQGRAGLQVNLAAANTYTYSLFFQGDENYNASLIASSKLSVVKKPTSIIANNMAFKTSAKTKTVTVALSTIKNPYDGKMYLKNGKTITLTVNGKTYTAKTTDNGVAKFNIQITKAGTYNAVIRFAGDASYQSTSKNIKIVISNSPAKNKALTGVGVGSTPADIDKGGNLNIVGDYADYLAKQDVSTSNKISSKKDTKIVVDATFTRLANDYSAGERGAYFYATLKDSNDNPLVGKTVQIAVNGVIYNETTDSKGRVGLQVNLAAANTYTYALSFSGDDSYNPAKLASSKLTVTKKATSITATDKTFKATAKTKTVTVTLSTVKNPYNGKTYLKSGKTLTLKVNGQTYTAKTNTKGQATFNIKLTKKGTYNAAISFAGDNTYRASSKTVKIKIS